MSKYNEHVSHLLTLDLEHADVLTVAADWYDMMDAVRELTFINDIDHEISQEVVAVVAALLVRKYA